MHEVETAKALIRLDYSLMNVRCFTAAVKLDDGHWVTKLRINTRCNHEELKMAIDGAVTYHVPPKKLKEGTDKFKRVVKEKAERDDLVLRLNALT